MTVRARKIHSNLDPRLRVVLDSDVGESVERAPQVGALRRIESRVRAPRPRGEWLGLDPGAIGLATANPTFGGGAADLIADVRGTGARADVEMSVFFDVKAGVTAADLGVQCARRDTQVIAQVTRRQLEELEKRPEVTNVERGATLHVPMPLDDGEASAGETPDDRKVTSRASHQGGAGILIGIVDVEGFDFAHPDFLTPDGGTRFVRIWDQGALDVRAAPEGRGRDASGNPFGYGAEFRKEHLDLALRSSATVGVPADEIEQQSQRVPGSHGTHVASISAGNGGVCPNAKIAGVMIALTDDDEAREKSFYDSTRVVHAIEYLFQVAEEEGCRGVSINVSLGTNGHAHDASDPASRWIDAALLTPGRAVTVAAGNAGQERPMHDEDIGFVTGRIHTAGAFEHVGDQRTISMRVVGDTVEDVSENELEIWYSNRDRFDVEVWAPGDVEPIARVRPGEEVHDHVLDADGTKIGIYNRLYHPANGCSVISVHLRPHVGERLRGIRSGVWKVVLHAVEIRDGRYDGWIERDDPRRIGPEGPRELWSFPAYFDGDSNVDERSLNSLGCGARVVSVANYDAATHSVHVSSSQGPTRDGRCKPDLAAPGTRILAANGFAQANPWTRKTGTSMASPYVCGVIGLMLAVNSRLTAAQITAILQRTARPLADGDFTWRSDSCYGLVDAAAAVDEAAALA